MPPRLVLRSAQRRRKAQRRRQTASIIAIVALLVAVGIVVFTFRQRVAAPGSQDVSLSHAEPSPGITAQSETEDDSPSSEEPESDWSPGTPIQSDESFVTGDATEGFVDRVAPEEEPDPGLTLSPSASEVPMDSTLREPAQELPALSHGGAQAIAAEQATTAEVAGAAQQKVLTKSIGPEVSQAMPAPEPPAAIEPWTNSLGMKFVPVGNVPADSGQLVLFSVWETRVRDYEAFCAATNRNRKRSLYENSENHPVVNVSWADAKAFCEWLTQKELSEGVLSTGQSYRLPTDQEWSRASGLPEEPGKTPEARDGAIKNLFPWGADWPPARGTGNFADLSAKRERSAIISDYDDGFPQSAPVGSFAPNQFGLYDMAGNVWEWCLDNYRVGSSRRVMRGGSWADSRRAELLSSYRNNVSPTTQGLIYGFRCVLVSPKPQK